MRLHAPSQIPLERIVPDGGLSISNTFLPPGTVVSTSAPLLHLNKEIYGADADTFRPERWLEAKLNPSRLMDMETAFFAFSRGNRGCTGRALAMLQMSMFVTRILRQFDIEWAEGTEQEWHVTHALLAEQSGVKTRFIEQTRECENRALMDALMDDEDETNYLSSSA
jgi:cytochrome P450